MDNIFYLCGIELCAVIQQQSLPASCLFDIGRQGRVNGVSSVKQRHFLFPFEGNKRRFATPQRQP